MCRIGIVDILDKKVLNLELPDGKRKRKKSRGCSEGGATEKYEM